MSIMGAIWKSCGSWFLRLSFLILAPDLSIFSIVSVGNPSHSRADAAVFFFAWIRKVDSVDAGVGGQLFLK